jgi:hypothetical protein
MKPHFLALLLTASKFNFVLLVQSAMQTSDHQSHLLQQAQTQLLVSQASLAESQEHVASLKSKAASLTAELMSSRDEVAKLKLQVADALDRAYLSESHAAQMQHISEHLQSSVSQQVLHNACCV